MRALCDLFREAMTRRVDEPLFDHDGRARVGGMSGKAMRPGGAEFGYLPQRKG